MSSSFAAIKPAIKLSDQVASALEAEIREGRIQAGDKLPTEAALAQQFEVSRTVVREALQHLQASGLVETFQGRGSYVLAIPLDTADGPLADVRTRADLTDLIEFRIGMESEAAALAAERRTPTQLTALQRALDHLSSEHRQVLLLRVVQQMSYDEIIAQLEAAE